MNPSIIEVIIDGKDQAMCINLEALEKWNPRHGEIFTVRDSHSGQYKRARLVSLNNHSARFICFKNIQPAEPSIEITLHQAVPAKERMELIIEKACELGVSKIIPIVTEKSIDIKTRDSKQKKSHNWNKLAIRAAKQCRRASIPEITEEFALSSAIKTAKNQDISFFLNEKEKEVSIKDIFSKKEGIKKISFFTGPEGGFSDGERKLFYENGISSVTMGKRILRTETAPISALSILLYIFEL